MGKMEVEAGREAREGGEMCIFTANSHCLWQKRKQYYKGIILQLNTNLSFKEYKKETLRNQREALVSIRVFSLYG